MDRQIKKQCITCGHSILKKADGQLYCTIKHQVREHLRISKKGKYWLQFSKACKYYIEDNNFDM